MRIALCMAGTNEGREAFWNQFDTLGYSDAIDIVRQENTPFGRSIDNYRNYPEDWQEDEFEIAAAMMENRIVQSNARDIFPKIPELSFIDYEPRSYDSTGRIVGSWMGHIQRFGMSKHDAGFISALLSAAKTTDTSSWSTYSLPRFSSLSLPTGDDPLSGFRGCAQDHDWIWQNCYPSGSEERDDITNPENTSFLIQRIRGQYELLSSVGRPVIPFIWPSYRFSPEESGRFNRTVMAIVASLRLLGCQHMGIWVDCTHVSVGLRQLRNLYPCIDMIDRVISS